MILVICPAQQWESAYLVGINKEETPSSTFDPTPSRLMVLDLSQWVVARSPMWSGEVVQAPAGGRE
jgi:hypothetical protein